MTLNVDHYLLAIGLERRDAVVAVSQETKHDVAN